MSQALVLVGDCRGKPCYNSINDVFMISQGTYWLLQKEDGKWAIKDAHNAWFIESPAP